ncbi:MAG TPA: tetratricopeptide repeat protein, partial [Firmicutes bacterium]|nr:tetratricopeptide repeat protein [Bacillota bacterium]
MRHNLVLIVNIVFLVGFTLSLTDTEEWFDAGNRYLKNGDYEKAIECFDRALELSPENDDIWYNKGVAHKRQGETDIALECYEK